MNRISKLLAVIVLTTLALEHQSAASDEAVDLPLPSGATIRFLPVFIGATSPDLVGYRDFDMGDREGRVAEERLAPARLGGSFLRTGTSGKPDWCYFLARTEITEAQWAAVMDDGTDGSSELPKTGVSFHDVQQFLHRYNLWLRSDRRDSLPSNEGASGYLRLPTEAEWEFACRGGTAVTEDEFGNRFPYPSQAELLRHEWLSGSDASSGTLKPVGRSSGPNPLGFYDLLGNAAEMTTTLFSVEYFSGRAGGCTVRGGHVNTLPHEVRSSMRTELPLYRPDGQAAASPHYGFRPVIGCDIVWTTSTLAQIAEELEKSPRVPRALVAHSNQVGSSTATAEELEKAADRVKQLKDQLERDAEANARGAEDARTQAKLAREKLQNTQSAVDERDRRIAELLGQLERNAESGARGAEDTRARLNLVETKLEDTQRAVDVGDRKIAAKSVELATHFSMHFATNTAKLRIDPATLRTSKDREDYINLTKPAAQERADDYWKKLNGELEALFHIKSEHRRAAVQSRRDEISRKGILDQAIERPALDAVERLVDEFKPGVRLDRERVFGMLKPVVDAIIKKNEELGKKL